MPTFTPNFNFNLPLVNNATDQDLWGGYLNSNWSNLDSLLLAFSPAGKIDFFPFNAAPTGYLEANGALISRTTYANLWTAAQASGNIVVDGSWDKGMFSTGDLSTTFRIPDYRGQFLRGWDDGAGVDLGRLIGTSQIDGFAAHAHTIFDPGHIHTIPSLVRSLTTGGTNEVTLTGAGVTGTNNATTGISIDNTGITETRPLNIAGMFCIKT